MAIGEIKVVHKGKTQPFQDTLQFAGDDEYATGGTEAFEASYRAAIGAQREILSVIGQDCGGYVPVYDVENKTLKVYTADYDGVADGPLIEVASNADLSAVTFNVLVLSR